MKKIPFYLVLIYSLALNPLLANIDSTAIVCKGEIIDCTVLIDGTMKLFVTNYYRKAMVDHALVLKWDSVKVTRYFLKTSGSVEEINTNNYKKMITRLLPDAPELHKRLGRRGFRFENVPYMVQYYNRFKENDVFGSSVKVNSELIKSATGIVGWCNNKTQLCK